MSAATGPIPATFRIAPRDVQALIRDLELQQAGYQLYYAVDSSEVIDYCFPLKPDTMGEVDLDKIAQDQTALNELFTKRQLRPLLIPHYVQELARYFTFVRSDSNRAYEDLEICRRLMEGAGDPDILGKLTLNDDKLKHLAENFVRMLAVWMGIFSIGTERFQHVLSHSLLRLGELESGRIIDLASGYKPKHADRIYDYLREGAEQHSDSRKLPQRLQAAQIDAGAIDWLIYINDQCAAISKNGGPKCLFLYLSSAPKTRRVFELSFIRESLPIVEDRPFLFWRTRHQLLVQAAAMRNVEDDPQRVADNLKEVHRLAQMVSEAERQLEQKPHAQCDECVQKGGEGSADCIWAEACKQLQGVNRATEDVSNLGLVARIKSYQDLLDARPKVREQRDFLAVFGELLKNRELPDLAMRRIEDMQSFALTQGVLVRQFLKPAADPRESSEGNDILPQPLRLVPYSFPPFEDPTYASIAAGVYKYSRLPVQELDGRRDLVRRAMQAFLEIDGAIPYPGGREHELVRLLLFLCFGGPPGFNDVLDRSKKLIDYYPESKYEFLTAGILAAQQLQKFIDVRDLIEEALKLRPNAGLLYLRRGINTFEWNDDERMRRFFAPALATSVHDSRKALELFRAGKNRCLPLEAAVLNNLAYFQCYSKNRPFGEIYDLQAARAAFDDLAVTILDRTPDLRFSEFLHTGAHLALQEAQSRIPGWEGRLDDGQRLIEEAARVSPSRMYSDLLTEIQKYRKKKANTV